VILPLLTLGDQRRVNVNGRESHVSSRLIVIRLMSSDHPDFLPFIQVNCGESCSDMKSRSDRCRQLARSEAGGLSRSEQAPGCAGDAALLSPALTMRCG
jgi:hypothetical protein